MNFLANENVPRAAVETLRHEGHDVVWARTDLPGAADREILMRAHVQNRVLITFDKDFGELAYRSKLAPTSGVILFRLSLESPDAVADRVAAAVQSRDDWTGHFAVVEPSRIRLRALPTPGSE